MSTPDHYELAPFPKGRYVNGEFFGRRLIECADSDLNAVLAYFDSKANDEWPYPWTGRATSAVVTEAEVQPQPGGKVTSSTKPLIDYDKAHILLKYSTDQAISLAGYRLHEEIRGGLQVDSGGRALLYWADGTQVLNGAITPRWYRAAQRYYISFFKLLASPTTLTTIPGCVNSVAYTTASLGYTFAAGTLLCAGANVKRGSPGGLVSSWKQVEWEFWYHPGGWNEMPRIETGDYEPVYRADGNQWLAQSEAAFTYITLAT